MQRVNFQTGIKLDAFAKFNHKAPNKIGSVTFVAPDLTLSDLAGLPQDKQKQLRPRKIIFRFYRIKHRRLNLGFSHTGPGRKHNLPIVY